MEDRHNLYFTILPIEGGSVVLARDQSDISAMRNNVTFNLIHERACCSALNFMKDSHNTKSVDKFYESVKVFLWKNVIVTIVSF